MITIAVGILINHRIKPRDTAWAPYGPAGSGSESGLFSIPIASINDSRNPIPMPLSARVEGRRCRCIFSYNKERQVYWCCQLISLRNAALVITYRFFLVMTEITRCIRQFRISLLGLVRSCSGIRPPVDLPCT